MHCMPVCRPRKRLEESAPQPRRPGRPWRSAASRDRTYMRRAETLVDWTFFGASPLFISSPGLHDAQVGQRPGRQDWPGVRTGFFQTVRYRLLSTVGRIVKFKLSGQRGNCQVNSDSGTPLIWRFREKPANRRNGVGKMPQVHRKRVHGEGAVEMGNGNSHRRLRQFPGCRNVGG